MLKDNGQDIISKITWVEFVIKALKKLAVLIDVV